MKKKIALITAFLLVVPSISLFYVLRDHDCEYESGIALEISQMEKSRLATLFREHSVYKRGNLRILYIHKDRLKNVFYFEEKSVNGHLALEFLSDSLEYEIALSSEVLASARINKENKRALLAAYVSRLFAKMDSLRIRGVSAEFDRLGVDLEFYFEDWSRLIFISNLAEIKNDHWKAFIANAKKVDEHWYYFCE